MERSPSRKPLTLFALFLVYLIPNETNENFADNVTQELIYVDQDVTTNDIFLMDKNNMLALTSVIVYPVLLRINIGVELHRRIFGRR